MTFLGIIRLALTVAALVGPGYASYPAARTWIPEPKSLSTAVTDEDPFTYEFVCHVTNHDPCDIGLEWKEPQAIGEVQVDYATLNWLFYQPAIDGQMLQFWDGAGWRNIDAVLEVDYRKHAQFAPVHGSGTVRWTYRFAPVKTSRVRVFITRPENPDPGFRIAVVRRFSAAGSQETGVKQPPLRIVGAPARMPEWLEPAANLAVSEAGAQVSSGNPAEVRWPRRLMLNSVRVSPTAPITAVQWWDGISWRTVEALQTSRPGDAHFLPIASARLRVKAEQSIKSLEVRLNEHATRYFREVESLRADALGTRFRALPRADLGAMQGLLLSLDFGRAAIGRPEDMHETIVLSSGAFLLTEPAMVTDPTNPNPVLRATKKYLRWFAFALGPELHVLGSDWTRVERRYADGHLPAVITNYLYKDLHYEERVHVTVPGDEPYGTAAEITVTNRSAGPVETTLTLAMGRILSSWGPTNKYTPFFQDIEATGYTLAVDRQTVMSADDDVMLHAQTPGAWDDTLSQASSVGSGGGRARENHLRYELTLEPGERRTLRFFVPDVAKPFRDVESLRNFDWAASFPRFRAWWNKRLGSGMTIDVPEPQVNDIARQLVAQTLITSLDGAEARYGAFHYETYYGLEEGWAAVALAQWGHPEGAQKIVQFMLTPENMKKGIAHHQYRNGLDPWYGITIYRLTRDKSWLQAIAPALQEAADWTIRVTNDNKDPKFGGILPKFQYGGDIGTAAHSFYANATCWRGLNDTALVFRLLGRTEQARHYQQEADRFRKRLWQLADELADRRKHPAFLPMAFDIGKHPDYREREPTYDFLGLRTPRSNRWQFLGNYWNLFASMFTELKLFEPDDPRSRWVPEYMETRGGVLAGLVRFDLGLDHVYGKGYYESTLERGRRDLFLTSLYGTLAHGMSQNLYSSPEVAGVFPLRTSNLANWNEHRRTLWHWWFMWWEGHEGWQNYEGEPLAAGAGVALQLLRMALVRETIEISPQDTLRLLDGAPAHWFEPGKKIAVRNAPTFFGPVSIETEGRQGSVRARVVRSPGFNAARVILRLPSPSGAALSSVTINGTTWRDFSGDEITLPSHGQLEIVADFSR